MHYLFISRLLYLWYHKLNKKIKVFLKRKTFKTFIFQRNFSQRAFHSPVILLNEFLIPIYSEMKLHTGKTFTNLARIFIWNGPSRIVSTIHQTACKFPSNQTDMAESPLSLIKPYLVSPSRSYGTNGFPIIFLCRVSFNGIPYRRVSRLMHGYFNRSRYVARWTCKMQSTRQKDRSFGRVHALSYISNWNESTPVKAWRVLPWRARQIRMPFRCLLQTWSIFSSFHHRRKCSSSRHVRRVFI